MHCFALFFCFNQTCWRVWRLCQSLCCSVVDNSAGVSPSLRSRHMPDMKRVCSGEPSLIHPDRGEVKALNLNSAKWPEWPVFGSKKRSFRPLCKFRVCGLLTSLRQNHNTSTEHGFRTWFQGAHADLPGSHSVSKRRDRIRNNSTCCN